jgi:hypothetical protein
LINCILCITFSLSCQLVGGLPGSFFSLTVAMVNSAALNTPAQVSLLYGDSHSFKYVPRSAAAGCFH